MTDIRRDSPIFTQKLSVSLSSASQEENEDSLLVLQVLPGTRQHRNGQQENFLHFEITNDVDLYFLYTLDIGEHDFHNLKREQHIVVDFLGFPTKFIGLINLCCQHQRRLVEGAGSSGSSSSGSSSGGGSGGSGIMSHFVTKLNLTSGVLSIVEVNEFNHVSHLNLQFRPGSDDSIKAYLSSSLKFATEAKSALRQERGELRAELEECRVRLEGVSEELRLLRENSERDQQCQQARHTQAQAQQQQAHLEALSSARSQADSALTALRDAKDAESSRAQVRIAELERELSETLAGRKEAEYSVRRLQGELEKSVTESAFYQTSQTDTAALLRTRDQEVTALERELARVVAKREALEAQILDKGEILAKATSLRDAADQSRQSALEQLELYKTGLSSAQEKLQAAVSEIRRGNEAIQQLQSDGQAARSKLQSKNDVIRKQEAVVGELRTRLAELAREVAKYKDDLSLGDQKRELLERELATARASIAEGAELVHKNQEVIAHLNEMINSLQLGGGAGGGVGGGMSGWASPVRRAEQPYQHGHFSYQASDHHRGDSNPARDDDEFGTTGGGEHQFQFQSPGHVSSRGGGEVPASHQPHVDELSQHRPLHKVSPDSVTFRSSEVRDEATQHKHRTLSTVSYKHEQHTTQRYSLSPQQLQADLDFDKGLGAGTGTGAGNVQKGYYDGVLDARLLEPSPRSGRGSGRGRGGSGGGGVGVSSSKHKPSADYIAGITRSNRGKPAAYSWQLDDFGREGDE